MLADAQRVRYVQQHMHGARDADSKRAWELCAVIKESEIVIFERAYVNFEHLWSLEERGVTWVTRAKENLQVEVVESYPVKEGGKIVSDELVGLKNADLRNAYPRVNALGRGGWQRGPEHLPDQPPDLECGEQRRILRRPWRIEVFFKQIKQTLQLPDCLGTSANAVRWRCGWHCWSIYYSDTWPFCRSGRIASPAYSPSRAPVCGVNGTCSSS